MTSQATEETEDNTVSGWSVPEEIQQILYGTSNAYFNKVGTANVVRTNQAIALE